MKDGKTAEAGIVGNEGFTGTLAAVGLSQEPASYGGANRGRWFSGRGRSFTEHVGIRATSAIDVEPVCRNWRYAGCANSGAQSAARYSAVARWLLMTQDRVDSGSLAITHDFLATMLGTDRPTVSVAAGVLQKKNLIAYPRGAVEIREPQETRKLRVRKPWGYPTIRRRACFEISPGPLNPPNPVCRDPDNHWASLSR